MGVKVVDASALAALLFSEPESEAVCADIGPDAMVAPMLIEYEVGNVCRNKCRRFPEHARQYRLSLEAMADMRLTLYLVDLPETLALAERHDLTFYDASYLWLSRQLAAPLVTLDRRLRAAH